jgi:hypothetical protein
VQHNLEPTPSSIPDHLLSLFFPRIYGNMEHLPAGEREQYEKLPHAGKKAFLQNILYGTNTPMQDEVARAGLAKVLSDLEREESKCNATGTPANNDIKTGDVVTRDITESVLRSIESEFGISRLSPAVHADSHPVEYPVQGIIYGPNLRTFVPMVVTAGSVAINVLFMFDNGAPRTHLREDTLRALGFIGTVPAATTVRINEVTTRVCRSCRPISNVDLLGQDWMALRKARVVLDNAAKSLTINA